MKTTRLHIRGGMASLAMVAGLVAGCENGPPGGGITNGSAPDLTADKAAIRTDGETRNRTDQGEMKGAGGELGGGERDSGSGGKGGNSGENPPAKGPAPVADGAGAPKSSGSAAGATKPQGDIKVGTPKGPQ